LRRLGASRGHLRELLGLLSGILEDILGGQAPKMPPRRPKESSKTPRRSRRLSKDVPDVSKKFLEAPNDFHERGKKTTD